MGLLQQSHRLVLYTALLLTPLLANAQVVPICPRLEGQAFIDCGPIGTCVGQCSDRAAEYATCKKFRSCGKVCQGTRAPKCDPSLAPQVLVCHPYPNECGESVCVGTKPDFCPTEIDSDGCYPVMSACGYTVCKPATVSPEPCPPPAILAEKYTCEVITRNCSQSPCRGTKKPKTCADLDLNFSCEDVKTEYSGCGMITCRGTKPKECSGACTIDEPGRECPCVGGGKKCTQYCDTENGRVCCAEVDEPCKPEPGCTPTPGGKRNGRLVPTPNCSCECEAN